MAIVRTPIDFQKNECVIIKLSDEDALNMKEYTVESKKDIIINSNANNVSFNVNSIKVLYNCTINKIFKNVKNVDFYDFNVHVKHMNDEYLLQLLTNKNNSNVTVENLYISDLNSLSDIEILKRVKGSFHINIMDRLSNIKPSYNIITNHPNIKSEKNDNILFISKEVNQNIYKNIIDKLVIDKPYVLGVSQKDIDVLFSNRTNNEYVRITGKKINTNNLSYIDKFINAKNNNAVESVNKYYEQMINKKGISIKNVEEDGKYFMSEDDIIEVDENIKNDNGVTPTGNAVNPITPISPDINNNSVSINNILNEIKTEQKKVFDIKSFINNHKVVDDDKMTIDLSNIKYSNSFEINCKNAKVVVIRFNNSNFNKSSIITINCNKATNIMVSDLVYASIKIVNKTKYNVDLINCKIHNCDFCNNMDTIKNSVDN